MKKGFTLAEILITLGIIGLVAAITIPTLLINIKAKRLKSQFMKAHSTVAQAYKLMLADDVSTVPEDYTDSKTFYRTFMRYFQGAHDCGTSGDSTTQKYLPCYYLYGDKGYKTLGGVSASYTNFDDGQFALPNGSLILVENFQGSLWVSVDINGFNNKPNIWGVDLFTFDVLDGGLVPMGSTGTAYLEDYCNKDNADSKNGIGCTKQAIDDPDYFKKVVKDLKL